MVTFKNNNNYRRGRFRNNDRGYKRGGDNSKFKSDYSVSSNFLRKSPGRNNHNASKLIDKYTDLAREALANEDKILSENYFQHADHFSRILSERQNNNSIKSKDSNNNTRPDLPSNNEIDSGQVKEEIVEKETTKS